MKGQLRLWGLLLLATAALPLGVARAQDCAVDFETLDFGATLLGEQRLRVLTVTNTGTAALPLDVPAQPCPEAPAFTALTSGHFDVPPGESQAIEISFAPAAAGAYSCELDLGTNDCPPVTLAGWGQEPSEPLGNHIGLYLDTDAQICQGPLDGPGQIVTVRVLAVLPDYEGSGISACEFSVAGLPPSAPPEGFWSVTWTTDLIIGNLETGIALAWGTPQPGPIVEIGTITFMSLQADDWIGPDHTLAALPGFSHADLIVVDAESATELSVGGGRFTFNCSDPPSCPCYEGSEPVCQLLPNSLGFGSLDVGESAELDCTIWNLGGGVLSGFVGEDCPDFEVVAGAGAFSLAGGEGHTITVRFAPLVSGNLHCDVDLGTDQCSELRCFGTAFAGEASCEVTPESLDFGATLLGEQRLRVLTVTNTGTASLPLDIPAQPCPEVPAFTVLTSGHFDVAPGASRVIQIRFSPTAAGAHECALDLGTNDCPPVTLRGWGQEISEPAGNHIGLYRDPEAQICQGPLDGSSQVVQVRVLAVLPDFAGAGITACEFRLANLPFNGVPPAGSYTATWSTSLVIGNLEDGIALAWSSPQPGPIVEIGYLVFSSYEQTDWIGPDHTVSVAPALNGSGLVIVDDNYDELAVAGGAFTFNCSDPPSCPCFSPLEPVCVLQPPSLNFGVVSVGSSSQQQFTIWNQGEGILAGFVGEDCPDFSITAGAGPFSLAAGDGRAVYVRFAPESSGPKTCAIELGNTYCPELICSGTGYAPEPHCQVTPASLEFGDLAVGATQDLSFVIRNIGVGELTGVVSEDCPHFSLIAGAGAYSLAANQTRTVTLRFAPSAPGAYECAVDLGSEYCEAVPCTGAAHEPVLWLHARSGRARLRRHRPRHERRAAGRAAQHGGWPARRRDQRERPELQRHSGWGSLQPGAGRDPGLHGALHAPGFRPSPRRRGDGQCHLRRAAPERAGP